MSSISRRIIVLLILSTGFVWLSAAAWIFLSTRAEVERVLDARLMEAGRMVGSLVNEKEIQFADLASNRSRQTNDIQIVPHSSYNRQLSCQIWSLNGDLLNRSESAPRVALSEHDDGFSDTIINGENWRVYAVTDNALGIRILVGDNMRIRDGLVSDVIHGLLYPAFLILPIISGLIWISVRHGLAPLRKIASDLEQRDALDLHPFPIFNTAKEITPVLRSLNGLFSRVSGLRERERNFTAFAAHELRTPLAGLKTQTQVALSAGEGDRRNEALNQIVAGVDRTGRLIRQLLDLFAIEANESSDKKCTTNPGGILKILSTELKDHRRNVSISIAPGPWDEEIAIDQEIFHVVMRNLLENAVAHSPSDAIVQCRLHSENARTCIIIEDEGGGIPDSEIKMVTQKFYRGSNRVPLGSGLGLAIVVAALQKSGWELVLQNRPMQGLSATIQQVATVDGTGIG